jgi:hypothetical protein
LDNRDIPTDPAIFLQYQFSPLLHLNFAITELKQAVDNRIQAKTFCRAPE